MWLLLYIILLPFVSGMREIPPMYGYQHAHVVWVATPTDYWRDEDKDKAREELQKSMDWWSSLVQVEYSFDESDYPTDVDVYALDSCKDREWQPPSNGLTLFIVAAYPTQRLLLCGKDYVADVGEPWNQRIIIQGFTLPEIDLLAPIFAHSLGHLHGALDTNTHDIMDKDTFWYCYPQHCVADSTYVAIRATRR